MIAQYLTDSFYRRPRVLNLLHFLSLAVAHTQTNQVELATLRRYAANKKSALEIGTHMGVSASVIAKVLAYGGKLYCIDPWPTHKGRENPCFSVCKRELARQKLLDRVVFLRENSMTAREHLGSDFDFIFIDGDHSYQGIQTDWNIVLLHLTIGGIVCLHDTSIPKAEPHRQPESVVFFNTVISLNPKFIQLERCHSMNILQRIA